MPRPPKDPNKFRASLVVNGEVIHLGQWPSQEAAGRARMRAALYLGVGPEHSASTRLKPASPEALRAEAHALSKRRTTSSYHGVSWDKRGFWIARTVKAGRPWQLTGIHSEREAALLHDRMALELHGESANLNFPELPVEPSTLAELQRERKLAKKTSRYSGVYFDRKRQKHPWEARIQIGGLKGMLGRFKTERQAALAYDRAALYNDPDVADDRLNFPKRRARLKPASPAELRAEARREYKATTQSRFRGVSQMRDKWAASIGKRGHGHHLGTFEQEEQAAAAYDRAAKKRYGTRALLNFHPETGEELRGKPLPATSTKTVRRVRARVAG